MPEFGSPFSGLANNRKLTDAELIRAISFMVAAEYEAIQLYIQLTTNSRWKYSGTSQMRNVYMQESF